MTLDFNGKEPYEKICATRQKKAQQVCRLYASTPEIAMVSHTPSLLCAMLSLWQSIATVTY